MNAMGPPPPPPLHSNPRPTRLLDYISEVVGEDISDAFATAIDEMCVLNGLGRSGAARVQAAAQLVAAITTIRCALGFDVISGILTVALEHEARLRDLSEKFRRPDAAS